MVSETQRAMLINAILNKFQDINLLFSEPHLVGKEDLNSMYNVLIQHSNTELLKLYKGLSVLSKKKRK